VKQNSFVHRRCRVRDFESLEKIPEYIIYYFYISSILKLDKAKYFQNKIAILQCEC